MFYFCTSSVYLISVSANNFCCVKLPFCAFLPWYDFLAMELGGALCPFCYASGKIVDSVLQPNPAKR